MSGVELALAIVPLVIAVIQHRRPLAKAGRALIISRRSNEQRNGRLDFYSQLYIELSMLHNTLEKLVGNIRYDDDEALQNHIHQALGTGLQVFEDILRDILQSVDDIVSDKSLGLEQMKLERTMLARLEFIKKAAKEPETKQSLRERFRLTKNEKSQRVAMKKIRVGNDRLFILICPLMNLDHQSRPTSGRTTRLPSIRSQRGLETSYKRLAKKWPNGCCSPFQHEGRLSLPSCCNTEQKSDEGIDIMVSLQGEVDSDPNWQEIRMTDWKEKTVRFADAGENQACPPNFRRDIDSESLCSLLHDALDKGVDLRIALEQEKLWQLRSGMATRTIRQQTGTPLRKLLPKSSHSWRLRERNILAVILAHAVLHCLESPWLCNNWSKDHVVFFQKESSSEIEFERPFLTIDFQKDSAIPAQNDPLSVHANPTILALGILLLEIYTQTAIESRREDDHLSGGHANPNTDLTTAINILKAEEGDVRFNYREAVKECLYWDDVQLSGDELRQKIYEKIVEPLERELEEGFGKENLHNICGQHSVE